MCRPLTRREFLRYSALVAATYPLLKFESALGQGVGVAVPIHLELVTVTDTQAVMTWFTGDPSELDEFGRPRPVDAPGRVLIGTSPDPTSWQPVGEHGPTPYHYVEISGLRPGQTYYWRAESNGVPAVPTAFSPAHQRIAAPPTFTTLVPPPGKELTRMAWLNDMHIGELTSGLAYSDSRFPRGGLPPGFPVDPDDPYWRTMGRASVAEARARGCRFMLVNGDLTNEAEPAALTEAKQILDAFGDLGRPGLAAESEPTYFVTRGNHDRTHQGATWASCSPVEGRPELRDCFLDVFGSSFETGTTRFSFTVGDDRTRYRFVGLDSNDLDNTGVWPKGELEYLEAELDRGDATIPLFHHPVGDLSLIAGFPPGLAGMDLPDATRVRELLGRYDNVAAVYNGHTHRNHRDVSTDTGSIPYFEGAATKEYPGGYTTVRLYERGFMVNFWKAKDPRALAWSERSRGEYLGLYPYYTLGALEDRNWVRAFDASASPPSARESRRDDEAPEPTTAPALPETGASSAAAGAALAAAGTLGAVAVSRAGHAREVPDTSSSP